MRSWSRWALLIAAGLGIIALVAYGFWPSPTDVRVATVSRDSLQVTVTEDGVTRVREPYVVSVPATGYLQRMSWEVGDRVRQDDVLAHLVTLPSDLLDSRASLQAQAQASAAQAALRQAEQNAEAARVAARFAQTEHERIRSLHASGGASQQRLDAVEADAEQARAHHQAAVYAVENARQNLRAAQAQLQQQASTANATGGEAVVRAPVDGQILHVHRESEGVVQRGTPLLDIGDPSAIEGVIDVLSSDAVRIAPGMPVVMERWGGPPLNARVRRVEPIGELEISALGVEEQRVDVIVDMEAPPAHWNRLGTGYRVVARFILWANPDVLQVPQSALFRRDLNGTQTWAVFVVEDGRAQVRTVEIGHRSERRAEVRSGLSAGDRVVVHPSTDLEAGMRVSPRSSSTG